MALPSFAHAYMLRNDWQNRCRPFWGLHKADKTQVFFNVTQRDSYPHKSKPEHLAQTGVAPWYLCVKLLIRKISSTENNDFLGIKKKHMACNYTSLFVFFKIDYPIALKHKITRPHGDYMTQRFSLCCAHMSTMVLSKWRHLLEPQWSYWYCRYRWYTEL